MESRGTHQLPLPHACDYTSHRDTSQTQHPSSIGSMREVEGGCSTVLLLYVMLDKEGSGDIQQCDSAATKANVFMRLPEIPGTESESSTNWSSSGQLTP